MKHTQEPPQMLLIKRASDGRPLTMLAIILWGVFIVAVIGLLLFGGC